YAVPSALHGVEILADGADLAVLRNELLHDVIERLEHAVMNLNIPVAMRHDVVAGAGLTFGGGGELVLLALRGDVVDLELDLVLLGPLVAQLGQRVVGAGHPMVPEAHAEAASRERAAHIRRREHRGGAERSALDDVTTGDTSRCHHFLPKTAALMAGIR